MKWELDDNARSGFHYLAVGVLLIGLPSLLFWGSDRWHSAAITRGELPLGVFHNGYFVFDPATVTAADTTRGERLVYACAIAVGTAAITIVLSVLFGSASAWVIGRWTFVVVSLWCVTSALFIPRTSATIGYGVLTVHERSVLMGDITIPFTGRSTSLEWNKTDALLGLSLPAPGLSDAFRMAAYRVHDGDTLMIATTGARSGYYVPKDMRTPADDALEHMDSLLFAQ